MDMTDSNELEPHPEAEEQEEPSPFQVALGFFVLPLLLVLGGVGVFLVFGVLAHDNTDPADFLPAILGRGINEPWQAAFHLSQQLQYDESLKGDRSFAQQVVTALEKSSEGDERVRRFLTVALGRIGHPVAVPILMEHTADPDVEVRVNSLWALGVIGESEAGPAIVERLRDDDAGVRTMASYVAGVIRAIDTREALSVALNDPVPAVRWNAAVALGLMGDAAGIDELGHMIDRDYLSTVPGVNPGELSTTMLAALAALGTLGSGRYETELIKLRDTDPDLRVREAARQALAAVAGSASGGAGQLLAQEH